MEEVVRDLWLFVLGLIANKALTDKDYPMATLYVALAVFMIWK